MPFPASLASRPSPLAPMTNNEFDNYLTLLSSLLQIRGEQREAIAKELRAHLEDRLEELVEQGIEHEEAVRIALADFGDAAGLAANFSFLSRNRRRRWMMKVTSFSMAVLVLLVVGLIAIWPEHRPGPAPRPAVAQVPGGPGAQNPAGTPPGADPNRPGGTPTNVASVAKNDSLDEKLSKRITAEFIETPIKDVLSFIADVADVQIFINRKALEEEGVETDVPVTISLKSVRVDMLLDLVMEQVGSNTMTYVERDGILIVSTMSNLEGASEVRVYNCRDLLAADFPKGGAGGMPGMGMMMPGGGMPAGATAPGDAGAGGPQPMGPPTGRIPGGYGEGGMGGGFGGGGGMGGGMGGGFGGGAEHYPLTEAERRAEALKQLLQTAIKPASWSDQGGFGTISEYNGLLVVNHNTKTHKQIESVLKMLREAAGLDGSKPVKVQR